MSSMLFASVILDYDVYSFWATSLTVHVIRLRVLNAFILRYKELILGMCNSSVSSSSSSSSDDSCSSSSRSAALTATPGARKPEWYALRLSFYCHHFVRHTIPRFTRRSVHPRKLRNKSDAAPCTFARRSTKSCMQGSSRVASTCVALYRLVYTV